MEKLRAGVPIKTIMTASVLAVTRSADLPPGHHGGPLHPLAGMYAILKLVDRLEGEDRFVPVLQHVARDSGRRIERLYECGTCDGPRIYLKYFACRGGARVSGRERRRRRSP